MSLNFHCNVYDDDLMLPTVNWFQISHDLLLSDERFTRGISDPFLHGYVRLLAVAQKKFARVEIWVDKKQQRQKKRESTKTHKNKSSVLDRLFRLLSMNLFPARIERKPKAHS